MSTPVEAILLEILQYSLLGIRAAGWDGHADRCALEADHVHNLPALLQSVKPELLHHYWEVDRRSFVAARAEIGIGSDDFHPLWEKLRPFVERSASW